jgi:hypothetical protein
MPLTRPVVAEEPDVRVEVAQVLPSDELLVQYGHGGVSVLATTLVVHNRGQAPVTVRLDEARITLRDPAGELAEVTEVASMGGNTIAPSVVPLKKAPTPVVVAPGREQPMWVAFRLRDPLVEPDLPREIRLLVPLEGRAPVELVLAEPRTGRPQWESERVTTAAYGGLQAAGRPHEASIGFLRSSSKTEAHGVVFAPSIGLGFRAGELRGEPARTIACCDLSLGFEVSPQFGRGRALSAGPLLGYQALIPLDNRADNAVWHGPAVGLQFFAKPIERRSVRAFPIRNERSVLGYSSFSVAYVHWFRNGDAGGSPGGILLFEQSVPEL